MPRMCQAGQMFFIAKDHAVSADGLPYCKHAVLSQPALPAETCDLLL